MLSAHKRPKERKWKRCKKGLRVETDLKPGKSWSLCKYELGGLPHVEFEAYVPQLKTVKVVAKLLYRQLTTVQKDVVKDTRLLV